MSGEGRDIKPLEHIISDTCVDITRHLLDQSREAYIISDEKGVISFTNLATKKLFGKKLKKLSDIEHLLDAELCLLEKDTELLNYTVTTMLKQSDIPCTLEAKIILDRQDEQSASIKTLPIKDSHILIAITLSDPGDGTRSYKALSQTNKELLEKIQENELLRSKAQSQAIKESMVNKISSTIRHSLEIETILQTAVEALGKTLGTSRTVLLKKTNNPQHFIISHEYAQNERESIVNKSISIEEDFFLQEVIETKEARSGQHVDIWDDRRRSKHKLIVPIIHKEELFGVILLLRPARKWHDEESSLVQSVADQISISIKNAQLFEDATSKNTKISVLNEILKTINSSLILDDVFYTIGREIRRLIEFDRASIAILDDYSEKVKLIAKIDDIGQVEILRSGPLIAKGTALSWAIENLEPVLIDMEKNKEFADTFTIQKSGIKNAIIIPMINKGNVTGIFYLGSKQKDVYAAEDVQIMSQIAGQIAIAVENAKLYWQTQTQALKETLINQIIATIRKSLEPEKVLFATAKELGEALGLETVLVKFFKESNIRKGTFEYSSSEKESLLDGFSEAIDKDSTPDHIQVIDLKAPVVSSRLQEFILLNNIISIVLIPLIIKDHITNERTKIGAIALCQSVIPREWTTDDISLLQVIAEQISMTLDQSLLFEQVQKQKNELEVTLLKLKEAQSQLVQSEKMAALGQLVAGVAHEINTPIGSITSNNAIFKKCNEKILALLEAPTLNVDKLKQFISMMVETVGVNEMACERITDIVKSLKNFARLDESELKEVDIHDGIESTLTLLKHELKNRVSIIKEYAELPLIKCYPNLLNQVFMNLLVNAIQSIDGKGSITIKTRMDEGNAFIDIIDTGAGISKAHLERIFDPGFTTKGVGVGTGLGLSICFQIIEKHNGKILVESEIGKGSTFTIQLPIPS